MRNKLVAVILAVMALVVIGCVGHGPTPLARGPGPGQSPVPPTYTPTATPTLLPTPTTVPVEIGRAYNTAIERAEFCGMKDDPTGYVVRYMTLGEYCELAGCGPPNPETPVYVVSLRTHYEDWRNPPYVRRPGALPCPVELCVVVVDAETLRVITTSASCHADVGPFPVP